MRFIRHVYFDAIVVKVRHEGKVSNRAIYLVSGRYNGGEQGNSGHVVFVK